MNYSINNGVVDVDNGIYLYDVQLSELPLSFGRIGDNFNCSHNKLTNLDGCPSYVGGFFYSNSSKIGYR